MRFRFLICLVSLPVITFAQPGSSKSVAGDTIKGSEQLKSVFQDRNRSEFLKPAKNGFFLEPYFGVVNSWMRLKTSMNSSYNCRSYAGFQFKISPISKSDRVNFLFGLNYSANSFQGDFENTISSGYSFTDRIHVEYSIIRFPLTLQYIVPVNRLQPFFSLGLNNILILNPKSSVYQVGYYPQESRFRKYEIGVSLGFGADLTLNNGGYVFIRNEFEYRMPEPVSGYILDHHRVLSDIISIGLGIKI